MGVLDDVNLYRINSYSDVEEFMRWLGERRPIMSIDTETGGPPGNDGGLQIETGWIRYAQIGDAMTGWAIPWNAWGGVVFEALKKYEGDWVLHNSKYDIRHILSAKDVMGDFVWPWHRTHDTMTMAHLADPLRPKGLKPLAARLVDQQAAGAQRQLDEGMTKNKWTWATVPMDFPPYWIYAALDPVLTCRIYEQLAPQVNASWRIPYDLEMNTTRVITKMESYGVRIDPGYTRDKIDAFKVYDAQASEWLENEYGLDKVTPDRLVKFFQSQGVELPPEFTPTGKQKMDKAVMQQIDHPVAKTVLAMRKADKMVGPYFENFLKLKDADDRLHPNVWTMGTRTARMSITDPALQTLPKRDPTVRTAFIPSDGMALISCDYDQIEARLMAHFSNSEPLRDAFMGDQDFFCVIASEIFGRPITKKDPERQLTKGTIYGKIYGAGVEKMAETAGVSFAQMQGVVRGFDTKYADVKAMQRAVGAAGKRRLLEEGMAYVLTPTGRRLGADDGKDYTLVNYLIQSHAAEIMKRALVTLDAVLPDEAHLLLPVHDEAVLECPVDMVEEVEKIIQEAMTIPDEYIVPITASPEHTLTNWGDLIS